MLSQPKVALDATGIRVLSAIGEAVPVMRMKRGLLFVAEHLVVLIDEERLAIPARQVRR